MKRFGLPRDEFVSTGGWPHQLYVREARRMVSDLVMTEHHTFGRKIAPEPVGLGSYATDTHEIRRIVKDGVVTREGKTAAGRGGAGPYPIGYGAIVPPRSECENLFVSFRALGQPYGLQQYPHGAGLHGAEPVGGYRGLCGNGRWRAGAVIEL